MKVIDLLNKIANDEELPKRIKLNNGNTFSLDTDNAYYSDDINQNSSWLSNEFIFGKKDLNEEIEIIEEDKKIEKINMEWFKQVDMFDHKNIEIAIQMLSQQLNELIDEVNKLKNKEGNEENE